MKLLFLAFVLNILPANSVSPTTTTTTTTTGDKCASEHMDCAKDSACMAIVSKASTNFNAAECTANKLCNQAMNCADPCWSKMSACLTDKACIVVFPDLEGNSPPTPATLQACASNGSCADVMKCKKIPVPPTKPANSVSPTTTTTTTTTGDKCASEHMACAKDSACMAIVSKASTNFNAAECTTNKLCTQVMNCADPCWSKTSACLTDKACVAVFPDPKGISAPTPAALQACASNGSCAEVMKCKNIPVPPTKPTTPTTTVTAVSDGVVSTTSCIALALTALAATMY